jgi:uncharacterized membrane protein YhaH (DUF805 family)
MEAGLGRHSLLGMARRDLDALLSYLQENSGRFPLERLRDQMLRAGHAPATADLAIGVFQGRLPPPEPPVWPLALVVTIIDFALAGLCAVLFSQVEKSLACSALALLPVIYFGQFLAGIALLSSRDRDQYRRGRALLLGVLAFVGLGVLLLSAVAVRYLSRT